MADYKLSQNAGAAEPNLPLSGREIVFASQETDNGWRTVIIQVSEILNGAATPADLEALRQQLTNLINGKAPISHTHPISQVDGLQSALDGKAPTSHSHTIAQVQGLQGALDAKLNTSGGTVGAILAAGGVYWGSSFSEQVIYNEGNGLTVRVGTTGIGFRYYQFQSNGNLAVLNGSISSGGGYDYGSSRRLKDRLGDGSIAYTLDDLDRIPLYRGRYKAAYNDDGRDRLFYDAEDFFEVVPEVVDMAAIEFEGDRVPGIKLDQAVPMNTHFLQLLHAKVKDQQGQIDDLKAMIAHMSGKA